MTDRGPHEDDTNEHDTEAPTARQLLHWATGDREAEAKALADAAPDEVTEDDANLAVRRSHGEAEREESPLDTDIATTEDAEAAHEERSGPRD